MTPNPVPLPPAITFRDRMDAILCRISNRFRMGYTLPTGLYSLGSPDKDSPVLVTANYKLSVTTLRAALEGRNVWILVVDTKGINVWCAAGKGTFCTGSIVKEITAGSLEKYVDHRTLILPQLGASGVNAAKLQKQSGFRVKFGPVRAEDIPAYLDTGMTATKEMRRVQFTFVDRGKLFPMETIPALKPVLIFIAIAAVLFGVTAKGILFAPALNGILPLAVAGGVSVFAGSVLVPLFLPFIPFRSFTLKGLLLGMIGTGILLKTLPVFLADPFLLALSLIAIPAYSSYCAFLFTGSTTYTSPSGVKIELKRAWPLYILSAGISVVLFILHFIHTRGII